MRRRLHSRGWLGLASTVVGLTVAVEPVAAQEDVPADTAAAPDTVAAPPDTLIGEFAGILTGVLADTAPDSDFAVLADPIRPDPSRVPGEVVVWDRERIRRSNAMHLGELLAEMSPGSLLLRAEFFGGPVHLLDGLFGPAALDVRIDGRPVMPLIGAQPDLSQFLLAMIDEVRVRRLGTGLRIDLTTLRRTDRRAYSRIEAGSGDPGLESLRLVFTNGIGKSFAATAGFELLDVANPETDLQGFSGGLAWLPGGGTSGVELQYEQRSFDRTVIEPQAGTRSRLVLGGRLGVTEEMQVGAWLGESFRELDAPVGTEEAAAGRRDGAAHGGVELRGVWNRGWGSAGALFTDDPSLPARELELEGGVHATRWLTVDAGGRLGAREGFDTHEFHVGAAARIAVAGADLRLHGRAASGRRGASYLAAESVPADSLGFDVLTGGLDVGFGPFLLGGRVARQEVNRQVSFGTGFDQPGGVRPGAEIVAYEVTADAPVLPLSWLLGGDFDPVRVRGFFRHNQIESDATPLYVPANLTRGELYFEDTFLEGDLGVRLALGLDRRDPWLAPPTAGATGDEAVSIPARSSLDFDLGLRIVGVLIFWRVDNIESSLQQDLPGFEYPVRRQVFGVRWAFYD